METFTYNGVTYTKQGDGTWKGSNGSTVSKTAGDAMLSASDSGGASDVNGILKEINGRQLLINPRTGAIMQDYGPVAREAATPDQNLGAGVFADARGYYVLDKTGSSPTDVQKRYITEAEAKSTTNPKSGGSSASDATAAGNLSARYAELGQRQSEFVAELALKQRQLDEELRAAAEAYALAVRKQTFYEEESVFNQGIGNAEIALAKQQLALSEANQAQQYGLSIATMTQQREIVNAQMQQATAEFNATMGFQVEQANVQAQQRKQEQVQSLGRDIAGYSADPGDRNALAAYVMANTGFGKAAQTEGVDLVTDESLTPLELALRTRQDVMASPDKPFSFDPIATPQLSPFQMPELAQRAQNPAMPTSAITPTDERVAMGTSTGTTPTAGMMSATEARRQELAAQGTAAFVGTEGGLWKQDGTDWVRIPEMETGGVVKGAFVAGDSSDGKENKEVIIPDFPAPGMTTVVPADKLTPKMKAHMGKMKKMETGGVFSSGVFSGLGSDRTLARTFQTEATQRARVGTPWAGTAGLPDLSFEATPGFDPWVAALLQGLRSGEQGLPTDWQQRQASLITPPGIREGVVGRTR